MYLIYIVYNLCYRMPCCSALHVYKAVLAYPGMSVDTEVLHYPHIYKLLRYVARLSIMASACFSSVKYMYIMFVLKLILI